MRVLLAPLLAALCAAALLLPRGARGEPSAGGKSGPPPATQGAGSDAARPDSASWAAPPRPRVTAGVLVRAAKRAQQRDASCAPCTARPGEEPGPAAPKGAIESLEIDWNADRPSP